METTATDSLTGPGTLHPDTQKNIGSMSARFKSAMGDGPPATPPATPPADPPADPPATPPADPPATPPTEDATPPAKESRSSQDFKIIKKDRDEQRARAEEAAGKLADLEAKLGLYSDYDTLKAQNTELNEALSVSNLEKHPKFREQFVKPINAQIERAQAYVPEEQRAQLDKILRMPIGEDRANALDTLTGELPPSRQAYLQSTVNRIDEIAFERDSQVKDSKDSYERLLKEEQQVTEVKHQERNKQLEKTFDQTLKDAQENISVFQLREGDEEWNTGVRERVALAKNILMEQNTFEDAATAALWAASGGAFLEQNTALVEHNRRLTEELTKLKGAEPNPAPSSSTNQTPPSRSPNESSFSARVLGELKDLRSR